MSKAGKKLQLSLVVAMGENGAIGRDNGLLWRLGPDMRRFRKITTGHPLIMGRKTWGSIGKPLPGRDMIVLTRDTARPLSGQADGVLLADSPAEAVEIAHACAEQRGVTGAMVIGGAQIYKEFLPEADRVYLTLVQDSPEADAFFAGGPHGAWRDDFVETWREAHPAGEDNERPFAFIDLARRFPG